MRASKYLIILFILVASVQLYVPARMILGQNEVVVNGNRFLFKTAPIDPNDPFRGKYILLSYESNSVHVEDGDHWTPGERAFAEITKDEDGFATIDKLSKTPPEHTSDYIDVKVSYVGSKNSVFVDLPFNRFYLEESKAKPAEKLYLESRADSTQRTYAVVMVKDGDSVLEDVMINDVSILELVDR